MEDPEEKNSFVDSSEIHETPLTICSSICRFGQTYLTMHQLIKTVFSIVMLEFICILAIYFMRSLDTWPVILGVLQMAPMVILYLCMYLNLVMGGWGASNSRFWCDVKIMYARGFNTIRTITLFFSRTFCFWFIAIILQEQNTLNMLLLPILAFISEWQGGLSENKNQYDVKVHDKFMKGEHLCLESLHYFQLQSKEQKNKLQPFLASFVIKTYVITCILLSGAPNNLEFVFGTPLVFILVLYVWCIPLIMDFMYLKSSLTFCQLELYRMIIDIIMPLVIACFALV
jgi:hypothetical protein